MGSESLMTKTHYYSRGRWYVADLHVHVAGGVGNGLRGSAQMTAPVEAQCVKLAVRGLTKTPAELWDAFGEQKSKNGR